MNKVLDAEVLDMLIEAIGENAAREVIALFLEECRELTATMAAPGANPKCARAIPWEPETAHRSGRTTKIQPMPIALRTG